MIFDLDELCWQHPVLVQVHTGKDERSAKNVYFKLLDWRGQETGQDRMNYAGNTQFWYKYTQGKMRGVLKMYILNC